MIGSATASLGVSNTTSTFDGTISGAGSLLKDGSGTLTLTGINSYTGNTVLAGGMISLAPGATLGSSTIIMAGGILAPSNGAITVANPILNSQMAQVTGVFTDYTSPYAQTYTGPVTMRAPWVISNGASGALVTFSGAIADGTNGVARSLTKMGTGVIELTGANTYTGGTLISQGTLRINNTTGSAFGTGAVTVAVGATLAGFGTYSGAMQLNGTYAPGNSPAFVTQPGDFAIGSTGLLAIELGGLTRGTDYDALGVDGHFSQGGTLAVSLINGFSPTSGETFDLFDWGLRTGSFATLTLPSLNSGLAWDTSALYTTGTIAVSAIPEPADGTLFGAFAALACVAWRRRPKRAVLRALAVTG